MPFNLGALSSGLVSGYDIGQNWQEKNAQKKAEAAWGNTLSSLGLVGQAPMAQPPLPGVPSRPSSQVTPTSFAPQGGVLPPAQLGPQNGPSAVAAPSPMGGQGAPMGQGGMFSLQDVVGQIRRANPSLNPNNPADARIIASVAGRALPFMRQADQEYYKQLTAGLQQQRADTARDLGQQRADTARDLGQQRADIARDRVSTARDQGWARIQQTSDKMLATAKMRQDNLALNYSRLEEAKRKGDITQQRLIENQIKNDRTAKIQTVNSVANLLRTATPEQLNDPVLKADMSMLQQQLDELKADPSASSKATSLAPEKASRPKSEDAAPAKSVASAAGSLPKPGYSEGGYTYQGGDPAEPSNWVKQGRPSPPLSGD